MLRFSSLILVIGRGRGRSGLGDLSWAEALSFRRLGSTIDEIALVPTSVAAALPGGIECDFTVDFFAGWMEAPVSQPQHCGGGCPSGCDCGALYPELFFGGMTRFLIDLLVSWHLRHGGNTGNACTVCSVNGEGGGFAMVVVIF